MWVHKLNFFKWVLYYHRNIWFQSLECNLPHDMYIKAIRYRDYVDPYFKFMSYLNNSGVTGVRQFVTISSTSTASTTPSTSTVPNTSTAPSTTKQSSCAIENNINYQGNDIGGQGGVSSAANCCSLCGQTVGCFSWSYFVQFSYCYLKSSATNRQAYEGMVSGVVTNKAVKRSNKYEYIISL